MGLIPTFLARPPANIEGDLSEKWAAQPGEWCSVN
jgi:hypothetical protein